MRGRRRARLRVVSVCLAGLPVGGGVLGSGGCAGWTVLVVDLVGPDVSCPGVVGQGGEQHDGGLVVDAPGGEALAVEGAFELGVEAFGVLAHRVQLAVTGAGGGDDAQVFAAVEPGGGVVGDGEQGFPPVVVWAAGAGQGVAGVELVPDGSVSAVGGVAFGLVPGQFDEVAAAVGGDGLFEQRAGGRPQLVPAAAGFAGGAAAAPGQGLGGVAVAVDDDAAVAGGSPPTGGDHAAASAGLDVVEVGAAPGAVGGERVNPGAACGEVDSQVGKHLPFAAGGVGGEVGDAEDETSKADSVSMV